MDKKEKLVLIDGNSLINRAFYALPLLTNADGEFSNAVYGFCNILIKLIEAECPKYIGVAFDMGYPTFRHELYKDYKAGRKKMPDELASQLPILKSALASMGIKFIEKKGIEADDIIGTLAKRFDIPTIIVSGDKDLFQLVDSTTSVWFTKKGISDTLVVTPKNIKEVYGVEANQVIEFKALMGDSSDRIKGVAGVGEKTAKTLLDEYSNIDGIYQNIENIKGKLHDKLVEGKDTAFLSRQLATININADIEAELSDLEYQFPFGDTTYKLFKKYNFNSILKRQQLFQKDVKQVEQKVVKQNIILSQTELNNLIQNLNQTTEFSIEIIEDEIHISNSKFEENIIKTNDNLGMCDALKLLEDLFKNSKIKKITLNSKKLKTFLAKNNIEINGVELDCNLAIYLLNGSQKTDINASDFSEEHGYSKQSISACLFAVKQELFDKLETDGMTKLYFDVELPLVDVLVSMEQNGFKLDINVLEELGLQYKAEVERLTSLIHEYAGEVFNIKSPKQLGEILFDKLNLKCPKTLKKGTGIEILERISYQHPIVDLIIRYRKVEKLYSTYVEPFKAMVDSKTGLIHTIFNQTLTSTGRLSSSEPNLQNIPIRDEEGKSLRKVFVPRDPNGSIVTSDYSQIELRLLAHYSQDPKLLYAYSNNVDIHSQTISDIYGLDIEAVTPELRRQAKTVNFGIIYGISDYGLSVNLNSSIAEAKDIIERYFNTYSQVKNYMDSSLEKAKQNGYVTTLFGRKRIIHELKSSNYSTKQFGERAAMNMPLQGTASDIIKIAMIKVYQALKAQNLKSKLILQIHDELIVDCACGEEDAVCKILKENMQNAVQLSVPLEVDIKHGKTWFEAK